MSTTMFRRAARWAALAVVVSFVSACGGGGDSGGGGSNFRVSVDRSTLSFSFTEGDAPAPAVVTATATGTPPGGTLYIGAVVEGSGVDEDVFINIGETSASFTIQANRSLQAGTYTGRVLLYACSDVNCQQPIGGTPLPVGYTVTVGRGLRVDPVSLSFATTSDAGDSKSLQVQLPDGITAFTAAVTTDSPWLSIGTPSNGQLNVSVKPWRSGVRQANIRVTAGTRTIDVPVSSTVSPPANGENDLVAAPTGLVFSTTENATSAPQSLTLTLPTWGSPGGLQIDVVYAGTASGWLQTTPTPTGVQVTASATTLIQGSYTAEIVVTPAAPGTAVRVPIALTVGPGLVRPADKSITVNADTTPAALAGTAMVQVAGGPAVAWTATSSADWLQLTRAAGTTGTAIDYSVDLVKLGALSNFFNHTATIVVIPTQPNMSPVSFTVLLRKELAEVHFVGPYLLVKDRPAKVFLRGRGFDGSAAPAAHVQAGTLSIANVTRVNDSEISFDVTPTTAGNHAIGFSRALDGSAPAATLTVIEPQTFAYAAVASSGSKRTIVLDAQRQSVYAVNVDTEALTRFRHQGGTWTLDAASIPAILDAGMAPDGSRIVVTATPGTLRLLHPDSLATSFTLNHAPGFARNLTYVSQGISATNDGRSWMPTGSGWGGFQYFDHRTQAMATGPQPGFMTSFYGGPWTALARNGERMLVTQSASISPSPPMLVMDAKDSQLRTNPAGLTFFYDAQLSDDGNRVLFDMAEVRDAGFGLIGRTVLPDTSYFGVAGAVSPDGRRAYVLAYPSSAYGQASPGTMPRVYAFDSSSSQAGSVNLPVVGQFDLQHYPTCTTGNYECSMRPRSAIHPDGATLFFVGDKNLVVAPIPQAMRQASFTRVPARSTQKQPTTRPWTP